MVHQFPFLTYSNKNRNFQQLTEVWNPFMFQVKLKSVIYTNKKTERVSWILIKMNGCVGMMSWAVPHHLLLWTQKAVQYVPSIKIKEMERQNHTQNIPSRQKQEKTSCSCDQTSEDIH